VCEREREKESKRKKEREKERASERENERENESVYLCMQRVRRCTRVRGTNRMKTQLALRVHEDVAARHELLLLHADTGRRRVVGLAAGSAAACSSCCRAGTCSSRSRSARPCSRRRRPSLRRAAAGPPSARTGGGLRCANNTLGLRQVHVVLPRRLVLQHDLTWICTCAHRILLAAYDASKTTGCTIARTRASSSCSL